MFEYNSLIKQRPLVQVKWNVLYQQTMHHLFKLETGNNTKMMPNDVTRKQRTLYKWKVMYRTYNLRAAELKRL